MIKSTICLILATLGAGSGWLLIRSTSQRTVPAILGNEASETPDKIDLSLPSPSLSPKQVVEIQLNSWKASASDPEALVAAYSMASPQNREITGPFARFSQMVATPPFNVLPMADRWLIGEEHIEARFASVLVSVPIQEDLFAFRFFLRKQDDEPYRDCWMTDTVEPQQLADLPTVEN